MESQKQIILKFRGIIRISNAFFIQKYAPKFEDIEVESFSLVQTAALKLCVYFNTAFTAFYFTV